MKNKTGTPVVGKDFYGRENELDYVWTHVKNGNNFIFPSPRREGKTSFAFKMLDTAEKNGWQSISINLEEYNELGFLEELANQLIAQSKLSQIKEAGTQFLSFIGKLKPTLDVAGAKVGIEWGAQQRDVYDKLKSLFDHDQPTLIFLDELTVLLTRMVKEENGKEKVSSFLHWLRNIRIAKGSKVRWILCSSVGITNFANTYQLSDTINDIGDYFLRPFDAQTSKAMLVKLAESHQIQLDNEIAEAIVNKLEYCPPYFLQLIFHKIEALHKLEKMEIDQKGVNKAYDLLIQEKYFNTWEERIREQYNEVSQQAMQLLKHVCQEKEGSKREKLLAIISVKITDIDQAEEVLARLIYMLSNDGYLKEVNSRYLFRSPLLRDFWFNRFVK